MRLRGGPSVASTTRPLRSAQPSCGWGSRRTAVDHQEHRRRHVDPDRDDRRDDGREHRDRAGGAAADLVGEPWDLAVGVTDVGSATILDALDNPQVFGPHFRGGTWAAWRAFLAALFGLPMDDTMLVLYRHHTGRVSAPGAPFKEAALVVGRRGGKSWVLALVATYLATFRDYTAFLAPGALPLLNSRKIELLDLPRLALQLCGLERRTARGGQDGIDHGPGGYDDGANAAAGALLLAATGRQPLKISGEALARFSSPVGVY